MPSRRRESRSPPGYRNCRAECRQTTAPGAARAPPAPIPAACARAPRYRSPCAASRRSPARRGGDRTSLTLSPHMCDEDRKRGKLLLDEAARGFVLELAGLLIELGGAVAD